MNNASETPLHKVVVNHEGQHSIWPADRENAPGWWDEGTVGTKAECLAHVGRVWTDLRPLSLREAMSRASEMAGLPVGSLVLEAQSAV